MSNCGAMPIFSEPVSYSNHFASVVCRLSVRPSVCPHFDYHVCDQRFLSFDSAEINETWHNNKTTPVVAQ